MGAGGSEAAGRQWAPGSCLDASWVPPDPGVAHRQPHAISLGRFLLASLLGLRRSESVKSCFHNYPLQQPLPVTVLPWEVLGQGTGSE